MNRKDLEELLLKSNAMKKEKPTLADRYDQFLRDFRRYEARFLGKDHTLQGYAFKMDDEV